MTLRGTVFTPAGLARRLVRGLGAGPVLDPACGDGELLLAVLEAAGGDPELARTGLFGIEAQPELAERARERLRRAAGLPVGSGLEDHVVAADALDVAWPEGTWIVANPPWVSFSGREAQPRTADERALFRERWSSAAGWPTLQGAFLERIAGHVATQGTGARVLVPATLIELERYASLRAAVTGLAALAAPPEDLGEDAFDGVIGPTAILTLSAAETRPSPAAWSTALDPELIAALEHLPRLPARTFADPGVHTGNSAAELIVRPPAEGLPGVREGRCLEPFHLGPPRAALRTDLERTPARRFRIGPLERYAAFPVLLRQTADRPKAALHTKPTFFRNSLLAVREVPGLDAAYVTAILNGPVATAWHRARFADARRRAFPQVKVSHLAGQPFPIAHRDQAPRSHDDLARRVRALDPAALDFAAERAQLAQLALQAFPSEAPAVRRLATRSAAP